MAWARGAGKGARGRGGRWCRLRAEVLEPQGEQGWVDQEWAGANRRGVCRAGVGARWPQDHAGRW